MVAFRDVPENKQDARWRDMAAQALRILQRLRLHEADNGRPDAEEWPEVVAALDKMNKHWDEAIAEILAGFRGRFVSADAVFKKMVISNPVDEEILLEKVRSSLSTGAKNGLWRKERDGGRATYATLPPAEPAPTTAPSRMPTS